MNDIGAQYKRYKSEIDQAIQNTIKSGQFIGGPVVKNFEKNLSAYLDDAHVIACANGTDALQIALMALDLKPGDEVITTTFTFAATAEVICLLGLKPVFVDIDPDTFCIDPTKIEAAITTRTRCIIPVHLFGQCADMNSINSIAKKYNLFVIEDAAQSMGSKCNINGVLIPSGTIGNIGTTSFFPSKNLGCFGDGGAIYTRDPELAERLRMICNHGAKRKYYHEIVGVNSRLDAIQAAILDVKLKFLQEDIIKRQTAAQHYDQYLADNPRVIIPARDKHSTHTFHQYTIRVKENREELIGKLKNEGIATMVYYPVPLHIQEAFRTSGQSEQRFPNTEKATSEVLSLPIYPDISEEQIKKITAFL